MEPVFKVRILGARGSVPVSSADMAAYGGGTLCVRVDAGDETIYLDAGSGIIIDEAPEETKYHASIILSHTHADHILGLPLAGVTMKKGLKLDIYGAEVYGLGIRQQVERFLSPPLWPVGPDELPAEMFFHDISGAFEIGDVSIETMKGVHPGGVTLYRLTRMGKSIVFMTDCTVGSLSMDGDSQSTDKPEPYLNIELDQSFVDFARDCQLLIIDGQYSDEEWLTTQCSSFGHNTWTMAADFGRACGAGQTMIVHYSSSRTDEELDDASARLKKAYGNATIAMEDTVVNL